MTLSLGTVRTARIERHAYTPRSRSSIFDHTIAFRVTRRRGEKLFLLSYSHDLLYNFVKRQEKKENYIRTRFLRLVISSQS